MRRLPLSAILAAALLVAEGGPAFAQQLACTIKTQHYRIDLILGKSYAGEVVIENAYTDAQHSVGCFSALRDMKYELYNSAGKLEVEGSTRGVPEYAQGDGYTDPGDMKGACKDFLSPGAQSRIVVTDIYPNIPHGSYTLYVTFSPRWSSETARSQAIPISI